MRTAILFIILIIGLFILLNYFLQGRAHRKTNKKILELLHTAERKYAQYIEKKITCDILDHNQIELDVDDILREAFVIIKPELESLVGFINNNFSGSNTVNADSGMFNNAISTIDKLLKKTAKKTTMEISFDEEKELYEKFYDAIKADLTQRMIDLKTGKI
jgi:Glu-tRNA(Gln) amidotransferase subunit E-like FAD-binding protein